MLRRITGTMGNVAAAQAESGFARLDNDKYYTEDWCTHLLCDHVPFTGPIWEPAAGNGGMASVLCGRSHQMVYATDIAPDNDTVESLDFFSVSSIPYSSCVDIVTNPPFDIAPEFVRHALQLISAHDQGRVWMLLPYDWDAAKTRRDLFLNKGPVPFMGRIQFNRRPYWIGKDESTSSPRKNFAWFGWATDWKGPPVVEYQDGRYD